MSSRRNRHNRARSATRVPAGAVERPITPQAPAAAARPRPSAGALQPYQVGTAALTQGLNVAGNNTIPVEAVADKTPVNLVFSPGDPIRPMPGMSDGTGAPRQWAYPVGSNISPTPRQTEATPFETLRALAALYEGIQLCEERYNQILDRLELRIVPSPEALGPDDDPTADKWRAPAQSMRDWFLEGPDRRGELDLSGWMKAAVKDIVEIDALGVYHRVTRGGGLFALELVAGDTLTCLEDTGGRTPLPPYPAYQQNLYGAPGVWLTSAELDYLKMTPRTNSLYGLSKVERIMLRVNQALRKESFDMSRFTDGATPMGIVTSSDPALVGKLSPEQLQQFEDMWNATLAGNDAIRVRTKFLLPGYTFTSTRPDAIATDFDRFLLNVTVASFGLTLDELGFTDTSNRSVGASQENVTYRNAVKPLSDFVAKYLTGIAKRYDGTPLSPLAATLSLPGRPTKDKAGRWDKRFCAQWGGIEEPEDFTSKVDAFVSLVNNGIISRTQAKRELKLPMTSDEPQLPLMVTVQGGAQSIVNLDTWVEQSEQMAQASSAQLDAQIAGSQQTAKAFASGVNPAGAQATQAHLAAQQHAGQNSQQSQQSAQSASAAAPREQQEAPGAQQGKEAVGGAKPSATAQNASGAKSGTQSGATASASTTDNGTKEASNGTSGDTGQRPGPRRVPARRAAEPTERWDAAWQRGDALGSPDGDHRNAAVGDDEHGGYDGHPDGRLDAAIGRAADGLTRDGVGPGRRTGARTVCADEVSQARAQQQAEAPTDTTDTSEQLDERTIALELGRYRTKALNAVKSGRRVPRFESQVLPPGLHRDLEARLVDCRSAEEVRGVFAATSTRAASSGANDDVDLTPGEHTGIMIALILKPDAARALYRALPASLRHSPYAEKPGDYHITLTYNGDTEDEEYSPAILAALQSALDAFVIERHEVARVLEGRISGVGRFTPQGPQSGATTYPVYASVDVPGIQALRAALCKALDEHHLPEAFSYRDDFEYTPHITLAYMPTGAPMPVESLPAIPLRFDAITLAQGSHRESFQLAGEPRRRAMAGADPWAAILADLREQRALVLQALDT